MRRATTARCGARGGDCSGASSLVNPPLHHRYHHPPTNAAVFEFVGAVLMGSGVTSTIRNGITDHKLFVDQPEVLAYGMLW